MEHQEKFLIIDGNALLHRAWHAIPILTTEKGEVVNAAYGFTMSLLKTLKEIQPTYVAVAFDRKAPTFRHEVYKDYKAKRVKQPEELYAQISRVKEILAAFAIPIFEKDGFEADDIIATLCAQRKKQEKQIQKIILTGDFDLLQLVNSTTHVFIFQKGLTDFINYSPGEVEKKYDGLKPEQLVEYKALRGDPSDNIPGVKGIGEKTAIALVKKFGSVNGLYAALEQKGSNGILSRSIREKLETSRGNAFSSLHLVTLISTVPIQFSLASCAFKKPKQEKLSVIFYELGFKSLLPRLQDVTMQNEGVLRKQHNEIPEVRCRKVETPDDIEEFHKLLSRAKNISILINEEIAQDLFQKGIRGISIAFQDRDVWYVPWSCVVLHTFIKEILEDTLCVKYCYDTKHLADALETHGITLRGVSFDILLGAYILYPGAREYSIESILLGEYGIRLEEISDTIQKLCTATGFFEALKDSFQKEIHHRDQDFLFYSIELPLVESLREMEKNGVKLDSDVLQHLSKQLDFELRALEKNIYEMAGEQFNIASPIQLKKILFEKLALSTARIRKGKTGLSTAASELEKMKHLHPIIEQIFRFRELSKLKNTYVDALPVLIHRKTGRLHTHYNQFITATGRLSSSNPNLQNIPIKSSIGKEIRDAFIAEEGYTLLSVDYSQIELRIIASIAHDKKMIDAFHRGVDIHSATAAEIHGVSLLEVTSAMRRAAKEINFGIIYGMSAQGLAESAQIPFAQAQDFIDRYFIAYPSIKAYMDATITKACHDGYVTTLFGRRRYLPELQSHIFQLRNSAERMAINMPIQGTAADSMKIAMIAVHKRFCEKYNKGAKAIEQKSVRMILQVHDELVCEVKEGLEPEVAVLIKEEMERAVELAVPLIVDVRVGTRWGSLKKMELT